MNNHEDLHARLDAFLAENFSAEEFFAEDFFPPIKPAEKISEKKFFAPTKLPAKICYLKIQPAVA